MQSIRCIATVETALLRMMLIEVGKTVLRKVASHHVWGMHVCAADVQERLPTHLLWFDCCGSMFGHTVDHVGLFARALALDLVVNALLSPVCGWESCSLLMQCNKGKHKWPPLQTLWKSYPFHV